ncbi:MAG: 1-deoxy-D-xylulose-5-phosphate synthase [Bacteroidales bacterium]|nr:1-deoxy-D-xylulose-5-phosphate synthase [Bacteroidales bacterium]
MEEKYKNILDGIDSPADLRQLPIEQLPDVCQALRQFIIEQVSVHPGHFASSLGAIEIIVALHYVYDTPDDRLVWDVGHQAYAHKILTGRREKFHTLRQLGGLSGFPSPKESEYDTFSTGHASNSISAALGMAVAKKLEGNKRKVVAVIGDASISGGMAFEGLNNASSHPNDLLILLNDNQMAIDQNVGALYHYLTRITTSQRYNLLRYKAYNALKRHGLISDSLRRALIRFTNSVKSLFSRRQNIFEGLDIRYFGPVNGHDVVSLVKTLRKIKDLGGPKMLHVCTIKGKGFKQAEEQATIWHAPGKFDPATGERIKENTEGLPSKFQDVFGKTLVELAEKNERIVGVTPAMPTGCSMTYMMERFPDRTFDVGIAEEHAVTFSGGLAKEGMLPFCNIYSTFMQRAIDQVVNDVSLQHLHVVFCLDRAGLVGSDGPTHHGVLDIPYFRAIPGMTVCSPIDEHWLRKLMVTAVDVADGPFMIRYPRGRGSIGGNDADGNPNWKNALEAVEIGRGYCLREGNGETAVLSFGPIGIEVAKAIDRVDRDVAHYDMVFCKPLDTELLAQVFNKYTRVITVEDGALAGGFGSAILEEANRQGYEGKIRCLGIPDEFITQGSLSELYRLCGIDASSIAKVLEEDSD